MRPEEKIEKAFVEACKAIGVKSEKLLRLGKKGFPDQTVLLPGNRVLFVEFKRPGGSTDYHQDKCHKELRELGFRVVVADTVEHPLQIVKAMIGEINGK